MKIGILGAAHGHVNQYCRQWKTRPELGIVPSVVWDHDAERAARVAGEHGLTVRESAEAVLDDDSIEAVVVTAETSMHADLVVAACNAGKRVVLQKPMALTLEQADRIVTAVNQTHALFTMAWQMRVDRQNLAMKKMLEEGRFGTVFMVRRRHALATHTMHDFDQSWHVKPEYNRDIWADDAAHPIDFVNWMFGVPESVTAELTSILNPKVPNDSGIAVFRYPDGKLVEVCCSFVCRAHEATTEIIAENGTIIQNYGDGPSNNVQRPEGGIELKSFHADDNAWTVSDVPGYEGQGHRIAGLSEPLARFLNGERGPIATAEEGRDSLRMMLACYESHESGRRVRL